MTHAEFVAWLERVETELPVADWRIRGVRVWPLVRLTLYAASFKPENADRGRRQGVRGAVRLIVGGLAGWAHAVARDWPANRRLARPADAVFLAYSVGTHPLIGGRRHNPLLAPYVALLEARGRRCSVWEMSPFGEYNFPRSVPSAYIQHYLLGLRVICHAVPLGRDEAVLDGYDAFLGRVREAGLALPYADITRLRRDVLFLRLLADRFRGWLRRTGATVGFVADAGLREQAFCLACRELGISSVEIQHGVQGDLHPAYGSWFAVPASGYETRPGLFWSWDERSAAAIRRWSARAPQAHGVILGGDPWREWWTAGTSDAVRRTATVIAEDRRHAGGRHHILVTLDSRGPVVPPLLVDAIRAGPADWRWWLRLHPVDQKVRGAEARRVLSALGIGTELLGRATAHPLHALLRQMDCHVTMGLSTVVSDAAALGVRSVACDAGAVDFFPAEVAEGALRIARTPEELLAGVAACLSAGRLPPRPPGADPVRAMDALLGAAGAEPSSASRLGRRPSRRP